MDKGGAEVVWRTDMYKQEALSDTSSYCKLDSGPTPNHQKTIKLTINKYIKNNELPPIAANLIAKTPRTPVI